ncbi:MAG TPA: aminotransferase class IV [Gemmatimonadales bacterium]
MLVYLNGAYLDSAAARVSVEDRGFLFGDGVYEVTRALGGRLFASDRHLRRLEHGMRELELHWPEGLDGAGVREVSERLLRDNRLTDGEATAYVQITRGVAPRSHVFPAAGTPPTVYAVARPFKGLEHERARGVGAILVEDVRWGRCDLKTIQLLPNVLAKQQAARADAFDAIQVRDGFVTEGANTNVFVVLDGVVRTHPTGPRILAGVTREIVLELVRELRLPAREEPVLATELTRASELFFTGTTTDVMPVVRLDGRPVGNGQPGPVARQLYATLRERMEQAAKISPAATA